MGGGCGSESGAVVHKGWEFQAGAMQLKACRGSVVLRSRAQSKTTFCQLEAETKPRSEESI